MRSNRCFRLPASVAFACALIAVCLGCKTTTAPETLRVSKDVAFTKFFRRTNGWVAGDGAISLPLSDGRVLWLFGDSHIDSLDRKSKTVPCLFQARNAGLLQNRNSLKNPKTLVGSGPGFRSWMKRGTGDDPWFWPLWGFEENKTVYLYAGELHQKGTGNFGFARTGHDYLATAKLPDLEITDYLPLPDFDRDGFGCGFVKHSDGFVYTYGMKGTKAGTELRVARFKANAPTENWTFWDGHAWSASVANCAAITRNYVVSLSVCKVRNKFVLIGSGLSVSCDMSHDIFMATADNPTGPFSALKKIYAIDDTVEGHFPFFYMPIAHPEFINRRNELLVTYSINGYDPCVKTCVDGRMNPDHYRPRAIRVPLKLIDPDFN